VVSAIEGWSGPQRTFSTILIRVAGLSLESKTTEAEAGKKHPDRRGRDRGHNPAAKTNLILSIIVINLYGLHNKLKSKKISEYFGSVYKSLITFFIKQVFKCLLHLS